MASAFQQLFVVLCIALTLAMSDSSTHSEIPRDGIVEESPELQPADAKVVNTNNGGPEKVGRHVRPLERMPSPWEPRPAERPEPIGKPKPMVQPEPVRQLRPMFRPEVPMEGSRRISMPGADFAEPQLLPQGEQGVGVPESRTGMITHPPKPGQCPVTVCRGESAITNKRDCISDDQCPGSEKCCLDPCRRRLVCSPAGLHVHPGSCPAQASCFTNNYSYKVVCNDDVQCTPDTKCCFDQCMSLYVCKPIVLWPPPPGPVWPPIDPVWPPVTPNPVWPLPPGPDLTKPDKCSYYCPGSVRCCDHMMRPGYCPSSALCYGPQEEIVLTPFLRFCESDFGCSRSDKCCFDQCQRRMVCRPMVYDSKAHPGQCPDPASRCEQASVEERTPCTDDRSCSLHERCCSSPCYRTLVCTAAFNGLPQPPVIPPLPPTPPGPDPNQCVTYCPGTKRCCDGVEKNGFCPAPSKCVGALINQPKSCTHDFDCEGGDRCCQDSCSTLKMCRTAVSSPTVHPGVCPAPPISCTQPRTSQPQPNDCSQDLECTMEQRCCRDNCRGSKTCQYTNPPQPPLPPSPTEPPQPPAPKPCKVYCPGSKVCCDEGQKEDFCPAPALCVGLLLNPPPRCLEDYDCSDTDKCCFDDCQKQNYCRPAVPHNAVHPGSCPPVPSTCTNYTAQNKKPCAQDSECRFEQRCCFDGCLNRQTCLRTKEDPNTEVPAPLPLLPSLPTCSFYCPGTKDCCDDKARDGHCPAESVCGGALINASPRCVVDNQCPGKDKCCFDHCERSLVCRAAMTTSGVHPGRCPTQLSCMTSNTKPQPQCAFDHECRYERRCCYDHCHRHQICKVANTSSTLPWPGCSIPCPHDASTCCDDFEKNDFCPAASKCVGAPISNPKTCTHDLDCVGGDKCCQDSCSTFKLCRTAVPSPTVHPGVCPAPPISCTQPSASQPQPNECSQDLECTMEQRCCRDTCRGRMTCQYTNPPQPPLPPSPTEPPANKPCKVYCPGSKVCCDEGDKEGFCPAPALCAGFLLYPPPRCLKDYDCSGTDKCCFDNCQKLNYCRPAVQHIAVHPGSCPPVPNTCANYTGRNKKPCAQDSECRFEQRCCFDGCLNRLSCLQTKEDPNTEVPAPLPLLPSLPTCSFYCPGTKDCCDDRIKPGICPGPSVCQQATTNLGLLTPPTVCQGADYSCPGVEKCCYDNCQRELFCRPIVSHPHDHLGQCPSLQASCIALAPSNKPECGNDSYCLAHEKCCADSCEGKKICKTSANTQSSAPAARARP